MSFPATLRDLLVGTPFGEVFPKKPAIIRPTNDGRTVALEILKKYISLLTFRRAGAVGGPPIAFRIAKENIHIEWPDHEVNDEYPGVVMLQVEDGVYEAIGLTSHIDESTKDVYAPGTVILTQSEYTETFALEVHTSLKPERRAVIVGLEQALTPTEQMYGIRFRMPDYYDQHVCFTVMSRRLNDDPDSARHRRIATLNIEMRYNVVALIDAVTMRPIVKVNVDVDQDTGEEVVLDPNDPNTHQVRP
jgi:hypothetical protein